MNTVYCNPFYKKAGSNCIYIHFDVICLCFIQSFSVPHSRLQCFFLPAIRLLCFYFLDFVGLIMRVYNQQRWFCILFAKRIEKKRKEITTTRTMSDAHRIGHLMVLQQKEVERSFIFAHNSHATCTHIYWKICCVRKTQVQQKKKIVWKQMQHTEILHNTSYIFCSKSNGMRLNLKHNNVFWFQIFFSTFIGKNWLG